MMVVTEEAILESVVFLDHFADLPDPRQLSKVIYPLDEILLLSLLAVLAGAETFTAIAQFGKDKRDLLRRFRPFVNGTPDHDRLGEVFAALEATVCAIGLPRRTRLSIGREGPARPPALPGGVELLLYSSHRHKIADGRL